MLYFSSYYINYIVLWSLEKKETLNFSIFFHHCFIMERKKVENEMSGNTVVKPGHSKWFPGHIRPHWRRPCFKGFKHVIIGDSQLKIYGQQKKEKNGFSITSFSGCDVSLTDFNLKKIQLYFQLLEFLNVMRAGFLSCERDRRGDVAILSRADIRKEYGLGRKGSNISHMMALICNI